MSVIITEADLKEAYAELEAIQQAKQKSRFTDELFEFVSTATGNLKARGCSRMSFADVNTFITNKGWADFASGEALRQAFAKEKARRGMNNAGI